MLEGIIFGVVFVAFFVLRGIAATVFFYYMLPEGDRCPCCDAHTVRVQSRWWNRLMPWFRTSWCYQCGWEGMLRDGPAPEAPAPRPGPAPRRQRSRLTSPAHIANSRSQSGQLPLRSKKSSK